MTKFIEIKDNKHNPVAINVSNIAFITHDYSDNSTTIVFTNDRRMKTKMFRSINEAVKWCKETEVDTSGIGEAR